jgi:hypothetical protein
VLGTRERKRVLITFFSYTGNTRQVARALSERLEKSCETQMVEIVPTRKRSYLHWLAYSFLPGSTVEIDNKPLDVSGYDAVLLGFPKWTLSCPPLNKLIHSLTGLTVPKFFLFMTCGGFDEDRFLRSLERGLQRIGCNVVECIKLKRRQISEGNYITDVDAFARQVERYLRRPLDGNLTTVNH